jgi:voltage-gated potassium channel
MINSSRKTEIELEDKIRITIHPQYEFFVIGLVIIQIINSLLFFLVHEPQAKQVVGIIFSCVSAILLVDFFYRFLKQPSKGSYLFRRSGWMDFLGSLPIAWFALFRLLKIILVTRTLRREDLGAMAQVMMVERARSTLFAVVLLSIIILEASALGVLFYEVDAPTANIQTGQEALWWAFVTIATVGYGDYTPVTSQGRLVGIIVMTVGVGLFTVLTGFLADWFRRPRQKKVKAELSPPADPIQASIQEIYRLLEEEEQAHNQALADIRDRLNELEGKIIGQITIRSKNG